jgi:KDO2-lipid IV(A) lauroyltransferase
MRAKLGMPVIYQDESPLRVVRRLRQGRCVAIVPDQDVPSIAGTFLPFFGHPAYTPTGPATLAYLANVPLIPAFARRTKDGLTLDVHPAIWPDLSADKAVEIERLTRAWSQAVETQIRKQPGDWMWFHERWRTTPDRLARRRDRRQRAG